MTDKITISGTAPTFDADELKQRQESFHTMYRQTSQCMELVRGSIPYEFLTRIVEKSKLGYVLSEWSPITTQPLDYSAHMIKPQELQILDLARIDREVKERYIEELEVERQRYRDLLTQQLLDKAIEKEAKKVEDAHKKLMANIAAEVNGVFGELIILE